MRPGIYDDTKEMDEFTGDGGSIVVHGSAYDTNLSIKDAIFKDAQAEGAGGGIYIAGDSDPANRGLFTAWSLGTWEKFEAALFNPTPTEFGGGAVCDFTRVRFQNCDAGFSGGGLSLCGRGIDLVLDECDFVGCDAGYVHDTDGKGGGLVLGGGHQGTISSSDDPQTANTPHGLVSVKQSSFVQCTTSDNGGGLYATISGEVTVETTVFSGCKALGAAGVPDHPRQPNEEGLGGGVHISAGGMLRVNKGTNIEGNEARNNGGGLSCKNGYIYLRCLATGDSISVVGNKTTGSVVDYAGNGGGVYVSTARNDGAGNWVAIEGLFGPGKLDVDDGQSGGFPRRIVIENNTAARWGGGIFVGRDGILDTHVQGDINCGFKNNSCGEKGENSPYGIWPIVDDRWPAEMVSQNQDVAADMKTSHIEGLSTSIGLYDNDSADFVWGGVTFNAGIGVQMEEDEY
jgi:hypothetical protein